MKIFLIGQQRCGKTTFARATARYFGYQYISPVQLVREQFLKEDFVGDQSTYETVLTQFALELLQKNPLACLEFIKSKYDLDQPCVIDGLLPIDFIHLFDPREDVAVILQHEKSVAPPEVGAGLIYQYLNYLQFMSLLKAEQVLTYSFPNILEDLSWKLPFSEEERQAKTIWSVSCLETAITDFCLVAFERIFSRKTKPLAVA